MNQIKIIPIASGSSGNAMLIDFKDKRILVDMGVRLKRINEVLELNGYKKEDIDAVFITHSHNDHIMGFKVCVKHIDAKYYASKRTRDNLANKAVKALNYDERTEVFDNFYVTMFETSHDCAGSAGYIFEYQGIKIGYATDLGYVSKKIVKYLEGSDIVILESNHDIKTLQEGPYPYYLKQRILSKSGHLSNVDCALVCKHLEEKGCKHFLLAHLSRENNNPEKAYEETREILKEADIYCLPPSFEKALSYEV